MSDANPEEKNVQNGNETEITPVELASTEGIVSETTEASTQSTLEAEATTQENQANGQKPDVGGILAQQEKQTRIQQLERKLNQAQEYHAKLTEYMAGLQHLKAETDTPKALPALIEGDVPNREGLGALQALDNVTIICAPDLAMARQMNLIELLTFKSMQMRMYEHCAAMKYRFAILDAPSDKLTVQQIRDLRLNTLGYDTSYAALYYPWIQIDDPLHPGKKKSIPPSGHIAGVYARTDAERGVHKAPANEQINGVIDLPINVTSEEQETLNPEGINCIRKFPGRGIRIWGTRTLSMNDKSWKYIPVRRLFNYVGASIDRDTQWTVFEPNDEKLWAQVRRNVTSFLRNVWRSGALYGNSPEEAFYVRCDADLNNEDVRSIGQMIVEIGLRPNYPAEFIIFRISQWAGPGSEEQ